MKMAWNYFCKGLFQYTTKTKMLLATKSNVFRDVNEFSITFLWIIIHTVFLELKL